MPTKIIVGTYKHSVEKVKENKIFERVSYKTKRSRRVV